MKTKPATHSLHVEGTSRAPHVDEVVEVDDPIGQTWQGSAGRWRLLHGTWMFDGRPLEPVARVELKPITRITRLHALDD